jgi:hypothetical protein
MRKLKVVRVGRVAAEGYRYNMIHRGA